tara:strand:+ start:1830 stop:2897 length:1068 start_codon:yes stop_codon:yes gene_type:complete
MDNLAKIINKLRKISFFLFLVPTIGLIGSLLFINLLIGFPFSKNLNFDFGGKLPFEYNCNKENKFCRDSSLIELPKIKKLNDCLKYHADYFMVINGNKVHRLAFEDEDIYNTNIDFESMEIKRVYFPTKKLNKSCIKNSDYEKLYNILPSVFYFIDYAKQNKKYVAPTSKTINPFFYGETSISNIVKRFPIKFFFKPLLYMTSLLMLFYWINYQKIFNRITLQKKINKFTIFGIASSIFLFLHIFFLGSQIDGEVFKMIRKLILLFFIFSELAAQFYLTKRLYLTLDLINKYISKNILILKIIFISTILLISFLIIGILIFYNLDSKVDYILEWNYFLSLLIFYLLSSIMWKKIN